MDKFIKIFGLLSLVLLLSASCEGTFTKPQASGSPYEVLVVADDAFWQRPAGRALFDVLDTDIPGLPQPEASFKVSQIEPKRFNQIVNIFRNIIRVDINDKQYTQAKMKYSRDVYAQPQVVITFQSPTEDALADYLKKNAQVVIDFLVNMEMNRLINGELEEKHSTVVSQLAEEMFGCQLWAPKEIKSYKKGKDFFWTSSNTGGSLVNICMYSYPYEGPQTFNKAYVLAKRDSVMKANIPGSKPNMYMATDTLCTTIRPIVLRDAYALEVRGLWQMENDGMGGPFVSHSRVDTERNRVMVVEGFVFAPEKTKRGLLRRLEGALYTFCLPGEQARELKANMPEVEVVMKRNEK